MQDDLVPLCFMNSTSCIIVNEELEEIGNFFTKVFGCSKISIATKPVKHGIINIVAANGEISSSILFIDRKSTPTPILDSLESISIKQIYIFVKDPISIQSLATEYGAQVTESNIDYTANLDDSINGNQLSKNSCTLEGPDRILINVLSYDVSKTLKGYEILLNAIQSRVTENDNTDDELTVIQQHRDPSFHQQIDHIIPTKPSKNNSPNRIYFPTLKVEVLSGNQFIPCPPNPKFPIPFETEIFKGAVLLAIRTNPLDPMYASFFNGRRLFECQIQGKFKRMPGGEYFVGTESTIKMELGLITRSISKAVLQFFGSTIPGLQQSFGDSQSNPNYQYPHLVAGMFSSLDKVVITPPGQTPPSLGSPFIEDPEHKKIRQKYKSISEVNIDLESTYSFSVNSSNMDLINWAMTGIPLTRPFDMRPFLGDSCIRLVGYELPKELAEKNSNIHPQKLLNYLFIVRLTHIDSNEPIDMEFDDNDEEFDDPDDTRAITDLHTENIPVEEIPNINDQIRRGSKRVMEDEEDGDEEDEMEDEMEGDSDGDDQDVGNEWKLSLAENKKSTPKSNRKSFFREKTVGGAVRNWFRRNLADPNPTHEMPESPDPVTHDHNFEVYGDLRYCPATIEISNNRVERGGRRIIYLLPWNEDILSSSGDSSGSGSNTTILYPRLRSYSEISKVMPMSPLPRMTKNKKFSEEEKRRRQIIETYRLALSKLNATQSLNQKGVQTITPAILSNPIVALLSPQTAIDTNFLMKPTDVLKIGSINSKNERWEGCVATARASRHWIEKYLILSKTEVVMVKNMGRKRNPMVIPLVSVLSVSPMPTEESPFPHLSFAFFQVETAARVHYFMVRSERLLKDWLIAFRTVLSDQIVKMESVDENMKRNQYSLLSNDLDEAYVGRPCDWKLDKRRIFNYRRIYFNPNGIPNRLKNISATKLMEGILQKAFLLSEITEKNRPPDPRLWIDFSDEISVLQLVDITKLNEREKVAFFLNLYHVMLLHGIIVLGPPLAWVNWQSFFNSVTYIIDCDIVSIAELEQNILRASMSKSSMLFSKTVAPQSVFPLFAIKQKDFRLNFCINNGSASMASCVPIYKAETLDRQLDEMTSLMLSETVEIDTRKRVIILPKICSAYLQDFSTNKQSKYISNVSPLDCVRVLASYLNNSDRRSLVKLLSEGHNPSVKFKNFNFSCRRFELYQQSLNEED